MALDPDHPGFRDREYRARRDAIAAAASRHQLGTPAPVIAFSPEEHRVWAAVWEELTPLHAAYGCEAFLRSRTALAFDSTTIPQLCDVNAQLASLAGPQGGAITLVPVAGLVSAEAFLRHLADGMFLATQYIRHHSVPLYTPEPDIVHELIGHAASFADPDFVALNNAFGRAAWATNRPEAMTQLSQLYWWTMEFGVVMEGHKKKAYGAGLLSSFGELQQLSETPLRPLGCDEAANTPYDPTTYQPVLFAAESFQQLKVDLISWLEGFAKAQQEG